VLARTVGSNFLSTIRVSATNDTRNASILPGEGHFVELGFEQAVGDFMFSRFDGEGRRYFTLFKRPDDSGRQVLTVSTKLGFSTSDTPVFERYYAGGFQSFRGFAYRGVSPQVGVVAIGGTFQSLTTLEYRLPVTADDMIQVVAFTDVGTVDNKVSFRNFRATVGVGLRVMVPAMGQVPLAFDFGFPVASEFFDDERIFSFYVGILQ
jgi:outer membrane protein insertion porin family